jgi:hypothetical protein
MAGFVNVGELIDVFRRTISRGERCGCGLLFTDCSFWAAVGERAYGGWSNQLLAEVSRLQSRAARQRHLPRLVAISMAGRCFRAAVDSYGARYACLYRAIAAEAGSPTVVDASKWPVQALALWRAGLDVRVIHLVRDVRGVAYSLSRRQVTRPQAAKGTEFMSRNSAFGATAQWVACQSEAELLFRCGVTVSRMRYEDFIREPRRAVQGALSELGMCVAAPQLAHIGEGQVELSPSHGLSGNPTRFRAGMIRLVADEAWREGMPRRDRLAVTAVGMPLLWRYRSNAANSERS